MEARRIIAANLDTAYPTGAMRSLLRTISEPHFVLCLALAVIASLQPLAAQPAPVRVEIGDVDKAFVVEPGSAVTLRARVAVEPGASFRRGGAVCRPR